MKEEPKSIWKKFLEKRRGYVLLFVGLTVIAFGIIFTVGATSSIPHPMGRMFVFALLYAVAWALAITLLIAFFRWVFCWRNFKRFLFGCACFATLVALFYAEEDWRGKYEWEKCKAGLEVKGEKLNWDDFIPAPVPDDQNFAMSPVWIARIKYLWLNDISKAEAWYGDRVNDEDVSKFLDLMPISASALTGTNWASHSPTTPDFSIRWTSGRAFDLRPWQLFYRNLEEKNPAAEISITPQPQSSAVDVLLALSKFDPAIEQLQQDSQLPYSRFPVQYDIENPAEILLPHLAALKQCAQVLQLRAIAELQTGQTDKAFDDIKLLLRLNESVQTEPFIITHLVRMVIMQMAIQSIYEGLAEHKWSDAQLAGMDAELAKLDYLADYQLSVRSENAGHDKVLDWIERKRSRCEILFDLLRGNSYATHDLGMAENFMAAEFYLAPKGWFYQGEILTAQEEQLWASAANDGQQLLSPDNVLQASNAVKVISSHPAPFSFLGRFLAPELSLYAKRTAYAQESADLARVAMALERYYLVSGQYPASLDALAPKYIQEVPADIINGQPLHYRLTSDGRFVLYSVGWNETDDGGVAVRSSGSRENSVDVDQGDWVWRYPKK
jgi:hypothetical protein